MQFVPKLGTIVTNMGTTTFKDSISSALFNKTRMAVLSLLFSHPEESFYLRQIVRTEGLGLGSVQRELAGLSEAGIITRSMRGRQVYYQANPQCPIFAELRGLIIKTSGVHDVIKAALVPLASSIEVAFIYGSVAQAKEGRASDVDLMVVGRAQFGEVVSAIAPAQETLRREINPTVYPPEEFHEKLSGGHHFLKAVIKGSKLFVIGDNRDLTRLANKRLAG